MIKEGLGNKQFSKVLMCLIVEYKNLDIEIVIKKKLKESAYTILRKWIDMQTPVMFSKKAWDLLKQNYQTTPLEFPLLQWKDRFICGKDEKGKSKLVYEHTTPISEFFYDLTTCNNLSEIEEKLDNYSGICWITREEDDRLTKNYRAKRPGGWRKCYNECGIQLS